MNMYSHGHIPSNTTLHGERSIWIVDESVKDIFITVTFSIIGTMICFFGTLANTINLAVFIRQGFSDTINISFFGLAVSDGGCLLTQLWVNIAQTPQLDTVDSPVVFAEIAHVTGAIPYSCFTRISAMITTYITFERCLCIAFPLKVKSILTSTRTTCINVSLFVIIIASTVPAFTVNLIRWNFYEEKNRTLLGDYFVPNRAEVENVVYAFNNFFGYFSFISIIIFTAILVVVLTSKAKWRQKTAAMDLSSSTTRDRRVIKMVVTIATVFIICFFPKTMVYFVIMVNKEFDMHGVYHNLVMMVISLAFCMETFNCSINLLIYRSMSSKYKQALNAVLTNKYCSVNKLKQSRLI